MYCTCYIPRWIDIELNRDQNWIESRALCKIRLCGRRVNAATPRPLQLFDLKTSYSCVQKQRKAAQNLRLWMRVSDRGESSGSQDWAVRADDVNMTALHPHAPASGTNCLLFINEKWKKEIDDKHKVTFWVFILTAVSEDKNNFTKLNAFLICFKCDEWNEVHSSLFVFLCMCF